MIYHLTSLDNSVKTAFHFSNFQILKMKLHNQYKSIWELHPDAKEGIEMTNGSNKASHTKLLRTPRNVNKLSILIWVLQMAAIEFHNEEQIRDNF